MIELQKALGMVGEPEIRREIVRFVDTALGPMGAAAGPLVIDEGKLAQIQDVLERRGHDEVWLLLDRFVSALRSPTGG